jgi:DNA-binding transcriptional MocR family regulator
MKTGLPSGYNSNGTAFRYAELADTLEAQVQNGTFRAGDRLPSIRQLNSETGLSISTVYQAFIELEKRGVVIAREKSGYYVKPMLDNILPAPQTSAATAVPQKVTINTMAFALMEAMVNPRVLQLGGALIAADLLPGRTLANLTKSMTQTELITGFTTYEHYMGHEPLRRQIAKRSTLFCGKASLEEIVVTNGCMEAVSLCLKAVAATGDTIVVESPTFPWFLQIIEDLGMYALEIPSLSHDGIDLTLLGKAIRRHTVKAAILVPNFNNPMGFQMPDDKKAVLVSMLCGNGIAIIEDDIYGELYFGTKRPTTLKALDPKGMVLYCGSFSKTVSPGLRVGWTMPGRFLDKVRRLKVNQTLAEPTLTQYVLTQFMHSGRYDRHLRTLRTCLKNQVSNTALAVAQHFPAGTKISAPKGGLCLWVQLPASIDSLELFRRAMEKKIAVLPGIICATTDAYRNCIRISCGMPWSRQLDQGLRTLAGIIHELNN